MVQDEIKFTLDEIAGDYDIVLVDSAIRDLSDNVAERAYDHREELSLEIDSLGRRIEYISRVIKHVSSSENIFTIREVVEEFKDYMEILNGQVAYHQARKSRKKSRRKGGKGKDKRHRKKESDDEHEDAADEKESLRLLAMYADQMFALYEALKDKVIDFDDSLLEAIIARAKEVKKGSRPIPQNKLREKRYTKEKLVVAAYELASKGKEVGVVSNSLYVENLFKSCFEKDGPFEIPDEGCIHLYSDPSREHRYSMKLNTIHLE